MSNIPVPHLKKELSHAEFVEIARKAAAGKLTGDPYDKPGYIATTGVNLRRLETLSAKVEPDKELMQSIQSSNTSMKWVLINEPWCSDGAFAEPVLHKIANASDERITLRILLRDKNPEVMDQFLTNGGRAIPKLIALNDQNEVIWSWGPRPEVLQNSVLDMLRQPDYNSNEKIKMVTRWYMKDKGQSMQKELLGLIAHHKQEPSL